MVAFFQPMIYSNLSLRNVFYIAETRRPIATNLFSKIKHKNRKGTVHVMMKSAYSRRPP